MRFVRILLLVVWAAPAGATDHREAPDAELFIKPAEE